MDQFLWNNLQGLFDYMNDHIEYVILRNFENLFDGKDMNLHPDIDILCRNRSEFLSSISTKPRGKSKDYTHRQALIGNKIYYMDIRSVGDGYLDDKWEKQILDSRILIDNIYIPNDENYFFSLLYHSLVQKNSMSPDYEERLETLAAREGYSFSKTNCQKQLENFMRKHGYFYVYPASPATIFNVKNADRKLIKKQPLKHIDRMVYKVFAIIKNIGRGK